MNSELLTCCRTPGELAQFHKDVEANNVPGIYAIQSNLSREKAGFRCTTCGRLYPIVEARHNGIPIDLKATAKPLGPRLKSKKAAQIFRGDHYYAVNKKTLLRFDFDHAAPVDETPIMGSVWYVALSPDERYIATGTDSGTVAIIDPTTKETIAKRKKLCAKDTLRFHDDETVVYFRHDEGFFCWNFRLDRETILWTPPEDWRVPHSSPTVHCSGVLEIEAGLLVYQLRAGNRSFALLLKDLKPVHVVRLPDVPTLSSLTYCAGRYILPLKDRVVVLDRNFQQIDSFPFPEIITHNDGGGVFPIKTFTDDPPRQVHLSPDGKWVLFDFHTELLLMDRETETIRYTVSSTTFTTSTRSGFLDDRRIWYNWAASTYIMEFQP